MSAFGIDKSIWFQLLWLPLASLWKMFTSLAIFVCALDLRAGSSEVDSIHVECDGSSLEVWGRVREVISNHAPRFSHRLPFALTTGDAVMLNDMSSA